MEYCNNSEKKCVNLVKCPNCGESKHAIVPCELGMIFEIVCDNCDNSYGSAMEEKSSLDNLDFTFDTYKKICEIWQKGACQELDIEYIPCKFE